MARFSRLHEYARRIQDSIDQLRASVKDVLDDFGRFAGNVRDIVMETVSRSFSLLITNLSDSIKALGRLIVDAVRWPIDNIIRPATSFLADSSEAALTTIRSNDSAALAALLLFVVALCACSMVLRILF